MRRRDFLHRSSHALASTFLFNGLPLGASTPMNPLLNINPENNHVLVMIFLNGGNDGLNTIIPIHQYGVLSQLRPQVLIPEQKVIRLQRTNGLGLHPSLTNLNELYNEGRLKVVRGVGYPEQNFSHFRSADIWMSGADANELIPSGVMGRYLDSQFQGYPDAYPSEVEPDPLAVELGASNSLLFQGPLTSMSLAMYDPSDFYELLEDRVSEVNPSVFADKLQHVKLIRAQSQSYGRVVKNAADQANNKVAYPNTELANQLKIVARLIAGGLRTPIYKVEIDGFDTHANQVDHSDTTTGMHANLLRTLDEAIMAFMKDLEALNIADRVLGMTFSEFGRRITSNASTGTDHGAAGPMIFFGNAVQGGILGNDYELHAGMTEADNLPYQHDFRQVYGTVLQDWLCVNANHLNTALLKPFDPLSIVRANACSNVTTTNEVGAGKSYIDAYPNPMLGMVQIDFYSTGENMEISLKAINGTHLKTIAAGNYQEGIHQLQFNTSDLPPGHYFLQIVGKGFRQAKLLQKV